MIQSNLTLLRGDSHVVTPVSGWLMVAMGCSFPGSASLLLVIIALPLRDERVNRPLVPILLPRGEVLCQITTLHASSVAVNQTECHLSKDRARGIFCG